MSQPIFAMFDDFFPNPEAVFSEITAGEFKGFLSPWDGVLYPGINQDVPDGIKNFVFTRIEQILNREVQGIIFARVMTEGMTAPHRIHSDRIMGEFSLHIYLSKEWPDESGTGFWEHKTEGHKHTDLTDVELIDREHAQVDQWTRSMLMLGKFNRAVFHDASLFHSAEPGFGWGDSASNGRLVLTVFFREAK